MKIYSDEALSRALFALAEQRMQAAGNTFYCSEAVFAVMAAVAPDHVSYELLKQLENRDFLHAVYLTLLQRPIDQAAAQNWESQLSLPSSQFQTALLNSVLHSQEYRNNPMPLLDCPLPLESQTPQLTIHVVNNGLPDRLVRIYQKLPRSLQKLAKKIAGKE